MSTQTNASPELPDQLMVVIDNDIRVLNVLKELDAEEKVSNRKFRAFHKKNVGATLLVVSDPHSSKEFNKGEELVRKHWEH